MNADILVRIRHRYETLSRAEASVAEWILNNPRVAVSSTIAQVATSAGVSEPTIIRFCRSLGLSGFRELRPLLAVSIQDPDTFLHQDVDASDGVGEAVGKVLDTSVRALVSLRSLAAHMPFEPAISAMAGARQLVFVGVGASGLVARDAQHKFFRLGVPCSAVSDIQTILQQAAIAQPGDVLVAISSTGNWSELCDAMTVAQAHGAVVIAITDPASPLAQIAGITFESQPVEDTNVYTPMSSRLVHLALLDALQVGLALALGDGVEDRLKKSKQALVTFRANAALHKVAS